MQFISNVFSNNSKKELNQLKNLIESFMDGFISTSELDEAEDTFNEDRIIYRSLFLYLFNKYNVSCIPLKDEYFSLYIFDENAEIDREWFSNNNDEIIEDICKCITKEDLDIIIIPLTLVVKRTSYSSLMIYRKGIQCIEIFEPQGKYFKKKQECAEHFNKLFMLIVTHINTKLGIHLDLITSDGVNNMRMEGLQQCEDKYRSTWCLFFTELVLKFPTRTSADLMEQLQEILDEKKENRCAYLQMVIRGYAKTTIEFSIFLPEVNENLIESDMNALLAHDDIPSFTSSRMFTTLYWSHVFHKYDINCFPFHNKTFGIYLYEDTEEEFIKKNIEKPNIFNDIEQIIEKICLGINNGMELIIIPVILSMKDWSAHANVLIYRKFNKTIEKYEPNGVFPKIQQKFSEQYQILINKINKKINFTVQLIDSDIVHCLRKDGLQSLEHQYRNALKSEGGGYCLPWSLFFIELVLKNPTQTSQNLMSKLFYLLDKKKDKNLFLRRLIRGYVYGIKSVVYNKVRNMVSDDLFKDIIADIEKKLFDAKHYSDDEDSDTIVLKMLEPLLQIQSDYLHPTTNKYEFLINLQKEDPQIYREYIDFLEGYTIQKQYTSWKKNVSVKKRRKENKTFKTPISISLKKNKDSYTLTTSPKIVTKPKKGGSNKQRKSKRNKKSKYYLQGVFKTKRYRKKTKKSYPTAKKR